MPASDKARISRLEVKLQHRSGNRFSHGIGASVDFAVSMARRSCSAVLRHVSISDIGIRILGGKRSPERHGLFAGRLKRFRHAAQTGLYSIAKHRVKGGVVANANPKRSAVCERDDRRRSVQSGFQTLQTIKRIFACSCALQRQKKNRAVWLATN